jgi:amino acid transporter
MAAWLPLPSGFTGYATRFVDPALGFCLGMVFWFLCESCITLLISV